MAKAKRKAVIPDYFRAKQVKKQNVPEHNDKNDENKQGDKQQVPPPNGHWGPRLRERQKQVPQQQRVLRNNAEQQQGTAKEAEGKADEGEAEMMPDVQLEEAEMVDILAKVFADRDVSEVPTLSPGAGLYAMANYAIEHEKKLAKKKKENVSLREDMLEPTFVTLEEAIQRDNQFHGKLLDAFMEDFKEHFETHFSRPRRFVYDRDQCGRLLHQHFLFCRSPLIEQLVEEFGGRYSTAAWVCFFVESNLGFLMRRYFLHIDQFEWGIKSTPLPLPRKRRANWMPDPADGPLADSIREFRDKIERFRSDYAQLFMDGVNRLVLNAEEVRSDLGVLGLQIECLVCTRELPLAKAVSCRTPPIVDMDGSEGQSSSSSSVAKDQEIHRFCIECLVGHARAATQEMPLAEGGVGLKCMAGNCPNAIAFSDCRFYIPPNVRRQLNARILEENLGQAKIDNLERCKECSYGVIIEGPPEEIRVFDCQKCWARHCRICQRPWDEFHFGRRCNEVETEKDQQKRELENMLSRAIIRRCHRCSVPFVKSERCNRMYCRCGATQCYICRAPNIQYSHFCQHFRNPGQKSCKQCKLTCLLWESAEEADRKAMANVIQQATQMGIAIDEKTLSIDAVSGQN